MDFYQISVKETKAGPLEIYPDFRVGRSNDLMVRGRSFYAIWDESKGLWSTDEYDVQRLVDEELHRYAEEKQKSHGVSFQVKELRSYQNGGWAQFRKYLQNISDNSKQLDENLTFSNTDVKKSDYVSRRLPYSLSPGSIDAWDELVGTLYSVEERAKIEWVIGAIVSGDSKKIQKFAVFYGPAGTGKSTILNIIEKLFEGYTTTFDAKALGSNNGAFATEVFKSNPLVAIQQDGDLSRIEDNTKLNSIVSHEYMTMNEKYKASYTAQVIAFLLMGTNQPVKISDAKSGIIRRLIDIHPTGVIIPPNHYNTLMSQVDFELGAIAHHCLQVYREMGRNYYNGYRPTEMMLQTDVFFNFIEASFDVFKKQDSTSLKQAYAMYKEFCNDTGIPRILPQYKVREELRNYFDDFRERGVMNGEDVRSFYSGFNANKFKAPAKEANVFKLVLDDTESLFDGLGEDWPAQYEIFDEKMEIYRPEKKWTNVKTTLKDIDTSKIHFVKVPESHIVIDFDLKDEGGKKSLERNLEAASIWPATYAELSKSGDGVHLHYLYEGDVEELNPLYSEGIEVKALLGDSSLRRRLTKCNNIPVAVLNIKLPVKEKKLLNTNNVKSEKLLRSQIAKSLRKEVHGHVKPEIDWIHRLLDEAHESGMPYDVSDLKPTVLAFANSSSNQSIQALKVAQTMKFKSEEELPAGAEYFVKPPDDRVVYFDVEVYPNLFVVCWKFAGDATMVKMINPTPSAIEDLLKFKLVGFNVRRYDNHILHAALLGYNNLAIYNVSKAIIDGKPGAFFAEAYSHSYADIYDYAAIKKGLKKWQVELGLPHKEMDLPWDEPVKEEMIPLIVDYCCNDVLSTEAVAEHLEQDFVARQILADLSGLTVNDTTAKQASRIIFGMDRTPQDKFVYTELKDDFPGYTHGFGKSTYKGEETGNGGYVYAEPGIYENVAVLDVASMHPTSIEQLNLFGPYTKNFSALKAARIAIKHQDFDAASRMLDGKLAPYLKDKKDAKKLSDALKIVINSVYGLTSASFENSFRDPRNVDNIVAKRGALFMIDLKHFVQERGFQVVHIKTDSIKIPNATPEIIEDVMKFGDKYGYDFEHEATYDKFCLVNDAVYIARKGDKWDAVGAQFQHPYVYKKLFSHEGIEFRDLCEAKSVVKGALYLDFDHTRPEPKVERMQFVGRTGLFIPVSETCGKGGVLYRVVDEKPFAATGTKGHLWIEADMAKGLGEDDLDMGYFEKLCDNAVKTIEKFGSFEELVA